MENLISQGETAQSINEKGDLVSGNDGNDMVFGTNKKTPYLEEKEINDRLRAIGEGR